ncbi:dynamin family protein [Neisseria subflava]|uniref:dynamin family protein n=1 Tax=Neisseria subflava TaxID=28449 RepID=UPI0020B7EB8B|nr:dynamin family protein [Neisseria subflava]UTG73530.1 dynamin family protein [Neisseria subflava]
MDIIQLNNQIEEFVNKNNFSHDALALKQEHAIQKSEEWQRVLDSFAEQGRVLRIGIIGRVKAGKSSMLNALLFNGNDILPKAATPMTAALTIMEYSENVSAEVDFFTQQDIDEIKVKYDLFQKALDSKVKEKELENAERIKRKKGVNSLSAEEQQECRNKAKSQAEREMKDDPSFASYDQYCRIKESGKSLSDLEQYRTISAGSVEELMNGALNQFVGSSGAFMPFTKSVTLHIPEKGLQGLQIIDTPGINDPVTSRGERTNQLLQHCDVVLIVSPSGQFLSSEDTDLMHQVTTKEGTQQAYLIASQVDNQLFGSESQGLSDPIHVLERISDNLTKHARNVLAKQVQEYPSMKVAADKLSKNNVICSSSVAFSMQQRFDEQHTWDANLQHVWRNLNQKFPDVFSHEELAKNALNQLANIHQIHQIVSEVTANKEQILAQRRIDFENGKRTALQCYLKAWADRINEQIYQIQHADVDELRKQEAELKNQQATIDANVGGVYDDLISDIKLNLSKQLKDKLKSEMRRFDSVSDDAQGSETEYEEYQVKEKRGGLFGTPLDWFDGGKTVTKTRSHSYTTVKAKPIRRAIEEIRSNLEDELGHLSESYLQAWKKKIYSQVVSALREAMGDGELDVNIIARAVKNVLVRIPEASFKLEDDIPKSLKKTGKLTGYEAESFIDDAEDYISNLKDVVNKDISAYMTTLVSNLKKIDLAKELTADLENNLKQLLSEIENKEASLFNYRGIQKELAGLMQSAA